MYSDLYFRKRNKLSLFALAAACLSAVIFLSFFLMTSPGPVIRASGKKLLRQQLVNLGPTEAGIFWQTENKETSWLSYGLNKNNFPMTVFDERDTETNRQSTKNHFVRLRNLQENTTYYFRILTTKDVYQADLVEPFKFKTPKNVRLPAVNKPAYGIILQTSLQPAENAFVIFNFQDKLPLLAMTHAKGEFVLPLNYLVTKEATIVPATENEPVRIEILGEESQSVVKANLNQIMPFPQSVILGRDYDFTTQEQVLAAETASEIVPTRVPESTTIFYPKEGSIIPGNQPLFKGTALPDKEIMLSVNNAAKYSVKIKANQDGVWQAVPLQPFANGDYILTLTTEDQDGKKVVLKRKFSIAKSGEQVLGEATAEATLTPTQTPTLTPLPTYAPTTAPTTASSLFTPTPAQPVTGANPRGLFYLSASLIIVGAGFLLVF